MSLSIWNQFDEVALFQSLNRLDGETNEQLFTRMKKFSKWRCKTDYKTQAHTIPIQTGLLTYKIFEITCIHPYEMKLDWEFFTIQTFPIDGSEKEHARVFINIEESAINKITNTLAKLPSFSFRLLKPEYSSIHQKFFIRTQTVSVETEYVSSRSTQFLNKDVLRGTFRSDNPVYCRTEKGSIPELKTPGDYFIDYETGFLQTFSNIDNGFFVSYRKFTPRSSIEATELSLIPLSVMTKYGLTDDIADIVPYLLNGKIWGK